MPKLIDNLLALLNKIFNKSNNNVKALPPTQSEKVLNDIKTSGIIKDFEREINNNLNIEKIDSLYGKKLDNERYIYNLPLTTKLSKVQSVELAKLFFTNLGPELSDKANGVIDNKDSKFKFVFEEYGKSVDKQGNPKDAELTNFSEVYCPQRGDLRDLYGIVHEIGHTFDLENGNTEARKVFGEIVPQCLERMLDEFLLNLSDKDMQKYEFNRNTVMQDVRKRQVSTFLSRKDNIKSFNNDSKESDLRYILAQLYSTEFMKSDITTRNSKLVDFTKNIELNDIDSCSKAFGINLENKLKMGFTISDIVNNVKNITNQEMLQDKSQEILQKILETSREGKNFKVSLGKQNVHINLESKIPFLLITSSSLRDGQTLVMESNNLEDNNKDAILEQALGTGKKLNDIIKGSNPIFIPILPSKSQDAPYYQQLSAECFENGERPDLDVVEGINMAKKILENEYGTKVNDKIFLNGYSTSGCFAQRFSLIHHELIDTACIGGASGSIPIPSKDLDYPLGIKNYEEVFNKKFDMESYKKIIFDYYVGSLECEKKASTRTDENGKLAPMHDMSYFDRSVPTRVGKLQRKILGYDMFERAEKTVDILKNMKININHKIVPNRTHNNNEAIELMKANPNYKDVKGINNEQKQIIGLSFKKMLQRQKSIDENAPEL